MLNKKEDFCVEFDLGEVKEFTGFANIKDQSLTEEQKNNLENRFKNEFHCISVKKK